MKTIRKHRKTEAAIKLARIRKQDITYKKNIDAIRGEKDVIRNSPAAKKITVFGRTHIIVPVFDRPINIEPANYRGYWNYALSKII